MMLMRLCALARGLVKQAERGMDERRRTRTWVKQHTFVKVTSRYFYICWSGWSAAPFFTHSPPWQALVR